MSGAAVALVAGLPLLLGVLVASRGRQRGIGALLVAHGLSVGTVGVQSLGLLDGRAGLVLDQLSQGAWVLLFAWLAVAATLLPDGRLPSPAWRPGVVAGLVGVALLVVGAAGDASTFAQEHAGRTPPLGSWPPAVATGLGLVGLPLAVSLVVGAAVAVHGRLRDSDEEGRTRLLWLVWGASALPFSLVAGWVNHFALGDRGWLTALFLGLGVLAVPVTVAVAVLRHRLFDIRLVLSRTLTYGLLVGAVLAVYAGVLEGVRRVGGDGTLAGLLAVSVVAVGIHPASSWLRTRVERRVYGFRSDPHRALRLLADRTETAGPGALTDSIAATVAEALRVDGVRVVEEPPTDEDVVSVPLDHRGEGLGHLVVEPSPGRRLDATGVALLHDLARYAAVVVRAERQQEALRASRSLIVTAREEERRRLRRDLHDGIGPSLAAVVLTIGAAERRADPAERSAVLGEARDEVRAAIAEVRRIVDDLRPPAIDEVGLLGAIRQRALRLSGTVRIDVRGPETLPALPAAVENAAFRIASEAMTNVVRHADATRCTVDLTVGPAVELRVEDDGRGVRTPSTPGVGWHSMRDRAAELGGTCTIGAGPDGRGVVVHAVLPHRGPTGRGAEKVVRG